MVRTMCKERAKSGINPLFSTIIWFASIYLFYILWGICEILFEFEFGIGKLIICLFMTLYYGWFLIYKILTEFVFEISKDELIIKSILAKRSKILLCKKLCNIQKICEDKKSLDAKARLSFKRPMQKGKMSYIVFKDGGKPWSIEIKTDEKFIAELKHLFKKGIGEK